MGKIDDMRKLREQSVSGAEKSAAERRGSEPKKTTARASLPRETEASPAPVRSRKASATIAQPSSKSIEAEEAKCPGCGKTKGVVNGVMVSHQKGLGKACPGSRQTPA